MGEAGLLRHPSHEHTLPTGNVAWRRAQFRNGTTKNVTIEGFSDSQLILQFITPHASDMLAPRSVVPFYEFPIYRTTNLPTLAATPKTPQALGNFNTATAQTLNSTNIQLNGIPDKLIIFARRTPSSPAPHQPDTYATITGISINWNTQAGLLSSMSPEQLYRSSIQSGLSNMSWDELGGSTMSASGQYVEAGSKASTASKP